MEHYENFMNGKFTPSTSKERIEVINSLTGQRICTVPESSEADLASFCCETQKSASKQEPGKFLTWVFRVIFYPAYRKFFLDMYVCPVASIHHEA